MEHNQSDDLIVPVGYVSYTALNGQNTVKCNKKKFSQQSHQNKSFILQRQDAVLNVNVKHRNTII